MSEDPLWYKDAIIYELHVRAFQDSNGDGIGDFNGLVSRLDYLADLGVNAIWLLPFYPSPLRDDGYDIADYTSVHPAYGTLEDFRRFLDGAHERGIKVITELVINHTSSEHPWFQRARRAPPGSPERDFYVWSETPERWQEARIIFKDFEASNWSWDPIARAYYWHRFYAHQPDLNYDNPAVEQAVYEVLDFWMAMGVDGMRLDAVPYLYERDGTNCENLPETHQALKRLRKHIDERWPNRMLLAEANQWPEDAAAYFGSAEKGGDECHMNFHFPLMPRMFMSVQLENRFPILDIMRQTPPIPEACQWAIFLRNHDELTLEMVTDEDRDYMYRVYASDPQARINLGIRRRLAPLLESRRKIELMNALLFSMPGTPVLYYGDEIGMGDNIYLGDRNGVRTPMQWSADRNAGFSRANPQRVYLPTIIDPHYHYEAVNVDVQQNSPSSLLWFTKRLIAVRKRYRAFGRGSIAFLLPDNPKVLAFVRRLGDEILLVIANLSRFVQAVRLELGGCAGRTPVELFGRNELPVIGAEPYLFTLPPHGFYWFALEEPGGKRAAPPDLGRRPSLEIAPNTTWESLLAGRARARIEASLPSYLVERRWFRSKAHRISAVTIVDQIPIESASARVQILLLRVEFFEHEPETYVLPLAWTVGAEAAAIEAEHPEAVVARAGDGLLVDALYHARFGEVLQATVAGEQRHRGGAGELRGRPTPLLDRSASAPSGGRVLGVEQVNTSIAFGEERILKVFRQVQEGINPELEIGRYLGEQARFPHVARVLGSLEYAQAGAREPTTVGILSEFVPSQGNAWTYTLDAVGRYYDRVLTRPPEELPPRAPIRAAERIVAAMPESLQNLVGPYAQTARLLGQRVAELHLALGQRSEDARFDPEPFTTLYQRSIYQAARSRLGQTLQQLRAARDRIPEADRRYAEAVLAAEAPIDAELRTILEMKPEGQRIRIHGDLHLGEVLFTGKDFVFIDFEGEPARPISERRFKRSAVRDVAAMSRSFQYVAEAGLRTGRLRPEDAAVLGPWADAWHGWIAAAFLGAYVERARDAPFLPESLDDLAARLGFFTLDKLLYEIGYELEHRPEWVGIPLRALAETLARQDEQGADGNGGQKGVGP